MSSFFYKNTGVVSILFCALTAFPFLQNKVYAQTDSSVVKISAEKAKTMMDSMKSYTLLDVRTPEEYNEGHIHGAVLLPDNEIKQKAGTILSDKTAVIFIYCRSGRRSAGTAQMLSTMGYTKIYDMGGIINWPYGLEK
jgi:rhodanese-related sulfurtransferase